MRPVRPLAPVGQELRELLSVAAVYVTEVVDGLSDAPAADVGRTSKLLADPAILRPPPEDGRRLTELLGVLDRAAAAGFNPASPGYLAFIPGSGLVAAAIADLVADVLNRYTGVAFPAPVLVALEADVLRWLADLFALPAGRPASSPAAGRWLPSPRWSRPADAGVPNFADYGPELTRDFRGLRLWLPLHLHGLGAFRAALNEKLDLAALVFDELSGERHLRVPLRPDLSTVAFRCSPPGRTPDAEDAATESCSGG